MKPNIDLNDPQVVALTEMMKGRAAVADEAAIAFEDSVRPIYHLADGEVASKQIGTCVMLTLGGEVFALSASHVFDPIGERVVLIGCGDKLHALSGDRFSSLRGASGTRDDDPIDASVLHIHGDIPPVIKDSCLTIDQIELSPAPDEAQYFVVLGFRAAKSKRMGGSLSSMLQRFVTIEMPAEEVQAEGVNPDIHVSLAWDKQVLNQEGWKRSPLLHGVSGGAIHPSDERATCEPFCSCKPSS